MTDASITLYGLGDTSPIHEPIRPYSELIRPALARADIRFASAARPYGERGTPQLDAGVGPRPFRPELASVFDDCGIDVASIASNHTMSWGPQAMLDTRETLRRKGVLTVGAGEDLEDACRPAFIERKGVRVAFLSFCSVLREGCAAAPGKPGVAPLRVRTWYEPSGYEPGAPPRTVTRADPGDMEHLRRCVAAARQQADVVVLTLHWGVAFVPRLVADYQVEVAQAGFTAGADLIFGHHPHSLRAIGVYGGKACFFSLSNFITTSNYLGGDPRKQAAFEREMGTRLDPDYPLLPFGKDAKLGLVAQAVLSRRGVDRVSFLPMWIDPQIRPQLLAPQDPRFNQCVDYLRWASEGFPHQFKVEGDEVVVATGPSS